MNLSGLVYAVTVRPAAAYLRRMKRALAAVPVLAALTVGATACGGTQGRAAPGPSGAPQAPPLSAPVSLSIRSVSTSGAHAAEVRQWRKTPVAIRLGDSRLRFLLTTSSCRPVGVSAQATARTLRLRLRPNADACEDIIRFVDVVVTLSRPVLRTDAITRVAVTYAPLHVACPGAGVCRRPQPERLPLIWPRI